MRFRNNIISTVVVVILLLPVYAQNIKLSEDLSIATIDNKIAKVKYTRRQIILAIMEVESNGGKYIKCFDPNEPAVGVLQIHPVMVQEVNRIIGKSVFNNIDRLDSAMNVHMFMIYQRKYNPNMEFEKAARIWNGGPNGMNKETTISYFELVKTKMNKFN